jgi:hypothetical protein
VVNVSGTGITAGGVSVVTATTMTATLTIAGNATLGTRSVSVTASGAASNAAVFTVNRRGLNFDGIDDMVVGPNLAPPQQLSLSFWFRPSALGEGNNGHIFAIRDDADNKPNIQLRLISGNKLRFFAAFDDSGADSFGYWDTPVNSVALNVLHHIAVVYDGSSSANNPTIYIDGVLKPVTVSSRPAGTLRIQAATWIIGNNPANSGTIKGVLDELRVYGILLTAAEVSRHYNQGQVSNGTPEPGLIAAWHFDESTGLTVMDYSGNGRHGTLRNNPQWMIY